MNWVIALTLIGGCLATPLQQGNLKVVKYFANRDGIFQQNEGIPVAPQPIIYNPQQPYVIEPSPLTYSSVRGGSVLNERDEQRHINVDEELEAREEGSSEDQSRPVEDTRVDGNVDFKDESVSKGDDQRPVQTETAALLGSSVLGVKGSRVVQPYSIDQGQFFPSPISGQRRLVESQPQLYGPLKSGPQAQVIYQAVNHQVPISVEEQRIRSQEVSQDVRRPGVQDSTVINQQPFVPREWVRQPVQQIQSGVKGGQKQIQWLIQPFIPSDISLTSGGQVGSQQLQVQPQVITIPSNLQGVKIVQRGQEETQVGKSDVQGNRQELDNVQPLSQPLSQSELVRQGIPDLDLRPQQQQSQDLRPQQQLRQDSLTGKKSVSKVVIQTTSQRQVPVVSGQRVVGYQLSGHSVSQPQQVLQVQQPYQQQVVSPYAQQNIQYQLQSIPTSDIQQYYQLVQASPLQSVRQQNSPYVTYAIQSPSSIGQTYQPIQLSTGQLGQLGQSVHDIQGVQRVSVQPISLADVQGSQRVQGLQGVQVQDQSRGQDFQQDVKINSQSVDQRQQRSFSGRSGVKGAVNV